MNGSQSPQSNKHRNKLMQPKKLGNRMNLSDPLNPRNLHALSNPSDSKFEELISPRNPGDSVRHLAIPRIFGIANALSHDFTGRPGNL